MAQGTTERAPSHSAPAPLLATKLRIPVPRRRLVARPRLEDRLDAALEQGLTLVSAPAGFGKTTLVGDWARRQKIAVAWLSLDGADNDPVRFLRYLVAAFQRIDPALGQDSEAALAAPQTAVSESAIAALINDLTDLPRPCLLVLDDLHAIEDPGVHQAIRTLVLHRPPALRLVLLTREDPELPLARLRAQSAMAELRAGDLRFSPDEAAAFLHDVMELTLAPEITAALEAQVEGWPAGLQLAALSLRNRDDPAQVVHALSGSHHFILEYLTEEVLQQLSPDRRDFLLETSVLDRLSAPLCNAVTGRGNSGAMLEELAAANAFLVALDDDHRWYRYHHLFADLLRTQLRQQRPDEIARLHGQAAAWYAAQNSPADALEHAFAAEDYGQIVGLLERHARQVVLQGYARTVEGWLQRLPDPWQAAGPRASLAFGWSLLLRGRLGDLPTYLDNALTAAQQREEQGDLYDATLIRAEALGLRAGLVSIRGRPEEGCRLAEEAVALAPADDVYTQGVTRFCLGTAYNYAGRTLAAIETYREALPICRASGNTVAAMLIVANLALLYIDQGALQDAAALCRAHLEDAETGATGRRPASAAVLGGYSQVLYQWNDLLQADAMVMRALELSRRGGHVAAIAYSNVLLARIRQAQGDLAGARAALDEAAGLDPRGMPAWVRPRVVAQQVSLSLAADAPAEAEACLAQSGVGPDDPTDHLREPIHLAYLRLLPAMARANAQPRLLSHALALADRVVASTQAGGRTGRLLEAWIQQAQICAALGNEAEALALLRRALADAEPQGYVRLFVDGGPAVQRLLVVLEQRLAREGQAPAAAQLQSYAQRLLAAFPALQASSAAAPQSVLMEPLTERELDVLRLMADGLTYQEVADRLVVSVNTVRHHVKGIYSKLGVDRRMAAVEQANRLGLLEEGRAARDTRQDAT